MRIYYRYLCLWFVFLLFSCTTSYQPSTQFPVTTDNCEVGCPSGGSDQTLVRDSYTLNNNSNTKFANWVAYKMTKSSQASGRPRDWKRDPALPPADTLSPDAYQNANTLLGVDRGHQAPLAGLGGASDWPSLNYLSNITPQKADLNQGAWVRLEDKEREYNQLYQALHKLPEQCKQVFTLCCLQDMKYQEAADYLGISINTVRTQMGRAYKILRNSLDSKSFLNLLFLRFLK